MALIPDNCCDKCIQMVTNSASLRLGVHKSCQIDNDVVLLEALASALISSNSSSMLSVFLSFFRALVPADSSFFSRIRYL